MNTDTEDYESKYRESATMVDFLEGEKRDLEITVEELRAERTDNEKKIAVLEERIDDLEQDATNLKIEKQDLYTQLHDAARYTNKLEKDLEKESGHDDIPVRNGNDELKLAAIARMYKNLTLEQLENIEANIKLSFKNTSKNYILELP